MQVVCSLQLAAALRRQSHCRMLQKSRILRGSRRRLPVCVLPPLLVLAKLAISPRAAHTHTHTHGHSIRNACVARLGGFSSRSGRIASQGSLLLASVNTDYAQDAKITCTTSTHACEVCMQEQLRNSSSCVRKVVCLRTHFILTLGSCRREGPSSKS